MNAKLFPSIIALALAQITATRADTLSVTASETPTAGLYNYSYQFALTSVGPGVDTLFLGSDDLSPLSLNISLDNIPVNDWSWLGNDVPQNYLEFFSTDGSKLSSGDKLEVTFTSAFAPATTQFAVGLDSSTGAATNRVSGSSRLPRRFPNLGFFGCCCSLFRRSSWQDGRAHFVLATSKSCGGQGRMRRSSLSQTVARPGYRRGYCEFAV